MAGIFVLLGSTPFLWMCVQGEFRGPCGPGGACPGGQQCNDAGVCVLQRDAAVGADATVGIDSLSLADSGCPSGVLCGQPAVCCGVGQECVEGTCVPVCQSGVRCLSPEIICCNTEQVCLSGACTTPGQGCKDSFDCSQGEFCEPTLAKCLPQPTTVKCEVKPSSVTFVPTVEWSWTGFSKDPDFHEVAASPVVADVDADGTPEVVFPSYNHNNENQGMLIMLDGATGKEELAIPHVTYNIPAWSGVAVGNIDSDKELEIILVATSKGIVALEHSGQEKWVAGSGTLAQVAQSTYVVHPFIADLDADGSPEIVVGAVIISSTGQVVLDKGMIGKNEGTGINWVLSTAADLDEDGKLEVVGGNAAYDMTGKKVWSTSGPDGFPAIADMDLDGRADVVSVSTGYVRVLSGIDGHVLFGPVAIPGGGVGGPPTVGDFDGDGRPEFSAAGKGQYAVYDLDCKPGGSTTYCHSGREDGILWSIPTQDISSSVTGSSLFDFQGDGSVEVLYNDECHLYVLDGKTGAKLMTQANTSRTAVEFPLIADVDGDNNSEFVIPSNDDQIERDKCAPPGTRGIRVFGDSADKWVRTRNIWNQHTYHITNVAASGQIPAPEERNWDKPGLNNFRQNDQGEGIFNAPDLVVSLEIGTALCPLTLELRARVTNAGTLGVGKDIDVSFYQGTPTGSSTLLATLATTKALLPGESDVVLANFSVPPGSKEKYDFWVKVDDDGKGNGKETECVEDNNTAVITNVNCPLIL
ncbi:MAG: VCBS repeat-containing protein, partial [Pseudomonadota bacterium]